MTYMHADEKLKYKLITADCPSAGVLSRGDVREMRGRRRPLGVRHVDDGREVATGTSPSQEHAGCRIVIDKLYTIAFHRIL